MTGALPNADKISTDGTDTLSRREAQCLKLLASGKIPKQICSILGLSQSAVRLYLSRSRRKICCATLYQAVARAAILGLLS